MSRRNPARAMQSARPPAARSVLERFPLEIWGTIFSLACVDNGYTGRSLSEVSRYINEASKPYKYQCIAVDDKQLCRLTVVLRKLTPDARRIKHLFISSTERGRGARFFQTDKNRLLITVASTLRSLEIYFHQACLALKFPLPSLLDLTLHGDLHMDGVTAHTLVCYPALQRMHWASANLCPPNGLIPLIQRTAPALTRLRISLLIRRYSVMSNILRDLEKAYASTKLRLSMPQIILKPSARDPLDAWRRIRYADSTFLLLKPADINVHVSAEIAECSWLAVCDYWDFDDEDLDTERRYL